MTATTLRDVQEFGRHARSQLHSVAHGSGVQKKTAKKTAKPSPRSGVALPVGAHPGNTGGKKGRSGRKRDEFRAVCRTLVSHKDVLAAARKVLKNPDHPAWTGALKWATENGYGKPPQTLEHTGEVKHEHSGSIVWGSTEIPL